MEVEEVEFEEVEDAEEEKDEEKGKDADEDDGNEHLTIGQGEVVRTLADNVDTMVDNEPIVLPE